MYLDRGCYAASLILHFQEVLSILVLAMGIGAGSYQCWTQVIITPVLVGICVNLTIALLRHP